MHTCDRDPSTCVQCELERKYGDRGKRELARKINTAKKETGTIQIQGQLEIDIERGVIYFHPSEGPLAGCTLLRISGLPTPIQPEGLIDINASTPGIVAYNYSVQRG